MLTNYSVGPDGEDDRGVGIEYFLPPKGDIALKLGAEQARRKTAPFCLAGTSLTLPHVSEDTSESSIHTISSPPASQRVDSIILRIYLSVPQLQTQKEASA